ncbi:MAG TPA: hypothetical protein VGL86_26685, partial [Polyangia bacterium]
VALVNGRVPSPPRRPNVAVECSMSLTAPSAYMHDFATGTDYCVETTITTPVILFETRKAGVGGDSITDRALSVRVDPSITAGTTVPLTGQPADLVQLQYEEGTIERRCWWFTGSATVVAQRPNLDVTFDATCVNPASAANGFALKGEFTSTL